MLTTLLNTPLTSRQWFNLQFVINSDLSVLSRWFRINFLQINASKKQAIAIGPSLYQYELFLNDSNAHTTDTLKILGGS